jgi:hypothetical protein
MNAPRSAFAVLLTTAVLLPLAATSVSTAAGTSPFEAQCNAKNGRYLFWPHGHPAIPSVGFPAFATPHLELYQGQGKAFPNNAQDAYIDSTGAAGVAKKCRKTAAGFINASVSHAAKTTAAHEISCNFKHLVSYRISGGSGGSHLQTVLSGSAVVVDVKMGPSGSSITWDKRYCSAKPAPS